MGRTEYQDSRFQNARWEADAVAPSRATNVRTPTGPALIGGEADQETETPVFGGLGCRRVSLNASRPASNALRPRSTASPTAVDASP